MNIKSKKMKSPNNNLPESQDNGSQPKKFRKVNDGNSEKVQPIKSLEFKSSGKKQLKEDQKFQDKSKKFKKKEGLQEKVENEEDLNFNSEDGKNMILITKMNKLATKLFDKKIKDNTEKVKIIENILKKLGPLLPKLINKRNASKFIQACYKFGSLVQRNRIFDSLKTADLSEIFKSKYGHFLLMKVVKKGTKEQKNKLFDEIVKNAWFFASHKEAGQVMDAYLRTAATPQQINKIKSLFKIELNQTNERMENAAMRIIEKDLTNYQISQFILCKVFKILIPNEKDKIMEKFKENILDLGKTKEGLSLALEIINSSNNKQKKLLLKSLKGRVVESIKENDKKFLIILKLLNSVDDREILNKYLIKEILSNLEEILKSQNGISVISSILIPKHNILNTMEGEKVVTTCKKDQELRREEIISLLLPRLIEVLEKNLSDYLKDVSLSRVISTILQKVLSDEESFEPYRNFVENVCQCFEKDMSKGFDTLIVEEINKKYLITHPDANRVIKNIIRLSNETKNEESKVFLENKIEIIYEFLSKNLTLYLKTRLIFLIIALIENTNYKEVLIQKINKIKSKIPENTQGLNILKQII